MNDNFWFDVVTRITPDEPVDLDPVVFDHVADEVSREVAARGRATVAAPSSRLWERDETRSHIGIRIARTHPDALHLALRLASAAAERGVVPVIVSSLDRTGLERFGFRVERLPSGPPDEVTRCEEEVRKLWDMPIIIDLEDAADLG